MAVSQFTAPRRSLGDIGAETAATLLGACADIALVVDGQGVILDFAVGSPELAREVDSAWLGRPWLETVTVESRPKVEALLQEADRDGPGRWRHVNHPSRRGPDLPVRYCAVRLPANDHLVLLGRNLQAIAALQQRLVEAQQSLERDYWRMRHVETRYRLLFQTSTDGVLVLDATTHRVLEANPAAGRLLGSGAAELVGRVFPTGLDADGTRAVDTYLDRVRVTGRVDAVRARVMGSDRQLLVSASLLRQENASLFLVRLGPLDPSPGGGAPERHADLIEVMESAPDAIVVTDPWGSVLAANAMFLELAQLASEEQPRGQSLDQWLGRPGVDLDVLLANLRQHGSVRLFATTLRGEHGTSAEVEISAAAVGAPEPRAMAFFIRATGQRVGGTRSHLQQELPRSVEQLTELVGRAPLKELVRESTDLIERLCIQAALELTGNNRASAAELLGLSRQSLYVKLRRYGLGDNDPAADSPSR